MPDLHATGWIENLWSPKHCCSSLVMSRGVTVRDDNHRRKYQRLHKRRPLSGAQSGCSQQEQGEDCAWCAEGIVAVSMINVAHTLWQVRRQREICSGTYVDPRTRVSKQVPSTAAKRSSLHFPSCVSNASSHMLESLRVAPETVHCSQPTTKRQLT